MAIGGLKSRRYSDTIVTPGTYELRICALAYQQFVLLKLNSPQAIRAISKGIHSNQVFHCA